MSYVEKVNKLVEHQKELSEKAMKAIARVEKLLDEMEVEETKQQRKERSLRVRRNLI